MPARSPTKRVRALAAVPPKAAAPRAAALSRSVLGFAFESAGGSTELPKSHSCPATEKSVESLDVRLIVGVLGWALRSVAFESAVLESTAVSSLSFRNPHAAVHAPAAATPKPAAAAAPPAPARSPTG